MSVNRRKFLKNSAAGATALTLAASSYAEIKGAKRWLIIFGVNIQPSEFLKPAFVIIIAWLFGESAKRPDMPANAISLALLLGVVALLVIQPDFGQPYHEQPNSGIRKTIAWYLANIPWVEAITSGAYREWIDRNYTGREMQTAAPASAQTGSAQ